MLQVAFIISSRQNPFTLPVSRITHTAQNRNLGHNYQLPTIFLLSRELRQPCRQQDAHPRVLHRIRNRDSTEKCFFCAFNIFPNFPPWWQLFYSPVSNSPPPGFLVYSPNSKFSGMGKCASWTPWNIRMWITFHERLTAGKGLDTEYRQNGVFGTGSTVLYLEIYRVKAFASWKEKLALI